MRVLLWIVAMAVAVFLAGYMSTAEPELLDVLERAESPPRGQESLLAYPTSFRLVSFDSEPIEIDGADGRWWSIGAWDEQDGGFAYTLFMYNADVFGRPSGGGCPFDGLLRETPDGRLVFRSGAPNADGLAFARGQCEAEPRLLDAEGTLFADGVDVRVTGSGFVLESPSGDAVFERSVVR